MNNTITIPTITPLTGINTIVNYMKCPNCGRGISHRVKKCVCGMEFK